MNARKVGSAAVAAVPLVVLAGVIGYGMYHGFRLVAEKAKDLQRERLNDDAEELVRHMETTVRAAQGLPVHLDGETA